MRKTGGVVLLLWASMASALPDVAALGLYAQDQFQNVQGPCAACHTLPQALWYFRDETFAVPRQSLSAQPPSAVPDGLPALIWTGSHQAWQHMVLNATATDVRDAQGQHFAFRRVANIATNHAQWTPRTVEMLARQPLSIRGTLTGQTVIARTVWPETYALDVRATVQPLQAAERLKSLVQFEQGGASSDYQSRLLWEKSPGIASQSVGKAALGILLNGAQGDDDEAHGGHFALATGVVGEGGAYASWLVNNYYNLANHSEKGIIAGVTPLDKYMGDLNSGQSFYRPSYMLVAVFSQPDIPAQIQATHNRVMQALYQQDMRYDHARQNCAGISIDTLRALGWQVPLRGVESVLKASAAYWYVAVTERSLHQARALYDYLNTEMTRLFPAVAFDAIGEDLLTLAQNGSPSHALQGAMAPMAQQLQALYFVRIPQFPSSRPMGLAPVYSFAQYLQQAPADRRQWKIIPVTPNPLPQSLRASPSRQTTPAVVPLPAALMLLALLLMVGAVCVGIRQLALGKKRATA